MRRVPLFLFVFVLVVGALAQQAELTENKTLSPYFLVKSDNPETDKLPLKSTSAKVNIAGVIADVTVNQEYRNEGKSESLKAA